MPLPVTMLHRGYFRLTCLIISAVISCMIAINVPLENDELRALLNVYLPVFVGFATLLFYSLVSLFSKESNIKLLILVFCVCVNILTGLILKLNFNSFHSGLQMEIPISGVPSISSLNNKLAVQNLDGFPADNRAVFSYTYCPGQTAKSVSLKNAIINHDISTIRIKNLNKNSVIISKALFSSKNMWRVTVTNTQKKVQPFPITIPAGGSVDLQIQFTAKALNKRVESFWWKAILHFQHSAISFGHKLNYQPPYGSTCSNINGKLLLQTGNGHSQMRPIYLNGIWEYCYENDWEPGLQMILKSLNFKTKVGFTYFDNGLNGEKTTDGSDEIAADYFEAANTNLPVKIRKIASYHGCCTIEDADTLGIYDLGEQLTRHLQYSNKHSGQMLLPDALALPGSEHLDKLSGPFAIKIGLNYTDRARNHNKKIGIRVWKAIDAGGKVISNAYILGSDYLGKKGTNYDYQDNVYYMENIKPYAKSTLPLVAKK